MAVKAPSLNHWTTRNSLQWSLTVKQRSYSLNKCVCVCVCVCVCPTPLLGLFTSKPGLVFALKHQARRRMLQSEGASLIVTVLQLFPIFLGSAVIAMG